MRKSNHLPALGGLVAVLVSLGALAQGQATPQAAPATAQTEPTTEAASTDQATLSGEELDKLMGPVALYPDSLLTQIMYSATVPLDVVKAGRFVADHADTPAKERAAEVEKTDWDPSVQALAAGFPEIVTRMNDHIDWTEQVGDAVLVQTDDVMDAVQRLRDQAAETGALTTNDAQTITINNDDTITIAPTDPGKVYVPAYNPNTVYTQPAPAQPAYVTQDDSTDFTDVLATGAMVFGGAMILDEIFDDDDDWDHYWRGPPPVNWGNSDFRPRPDVNVDGNVNIGNRVDIGDRRADLDRRRNERIGGIDHNRLDIDKDRHFKPTSVQRDAAKGKIEQRKAKGDGVASLPSAGNARKAVEGRTGDKPRASNVHKPVVKNPDAARAKASSAASHHKANVSRPSGQAHKAVRKAPQRSSAFEMRGGSRAKAAGHRGRASHGRGR